MTKLSKHSQAEQASSDVRSSLTVSDQSAADESIHKRLNRETLNRLNRYFEKRDADEAAWLQIPEMPTQLEVASIDEAGNFSQQHVVLQENRLEEPYESVEQYLETQYRLLREDAVSTLRDAVEDMAASPHQLENQSLQKIRIYNRVYITGLTCANEGLAHRLEFHTDRVDKRIAWAQSKRLKSGTLIALSPAEPKAHVFAERCLIGIVAARPLSELQKEQPTIDVYFADPSMMDIDPQVEYMMIEASNGYFEAVRHTLQALQHMRHERFPLSEYLVDSQNHVDIPDSLKEDPYLEIGTALIGEVQKNVDIVSGWPKVHHNIDVGTANALPPGLSPASLATSLDESQFEALRRILTKRLAIVQGPPGTGKTHVSVIALKTLLANRKLEDPPIIVAAQTNHALDQLLRHIAPAAPDFIRLGGQTQDQHVVASRTLYQVKDNDKNGHRDLRQAVRIARHALESVGKRMRELLEPLTKDTPIDPNAFLKAGLISQKQCTSLVEAKSDWAGTTGDAAESPVSRWSNGDVQPFEKASPERDLNVIGNEDDDEDLYQMKDIELETGVVEDEEKDKLYGYTITFHAGYTGGWSESSKKSELLLAKCADLSEVPAARRGPLYIYLQRKLKEKLLPEFRKLAIQAKELSLRLRIARAQLDAAYLREAPVLGMTTTGLSKNRGLLSTLCPKIVLIEEAAETQEAYVTAACFESLDRLILVGDHLQLQAHCQNQELEAWNLHISLFERLVHYHGIEFQQLTTQRRMLPEMREVMNVIYPSLKDHPCVQRRQNIPGMNGINSWFMSHSTLESADEQFSWVNEEEARLVAGFYEYLTRNGTMDKDITILTFYKGQQRMLRQLLRRQMPQQGTINISTVDAYQGEENEVIILSLVRNNERRSMGFLKVINRVCVAMSRARRGFYIFGYSSLLAKNNWDWNKMITIYRERGSLAYYMPITCVKHGKKIRIYGSADWHNIEGGCDQYCRTRLVCGHDCPSRCHPEDHEQLPCMQDCTRKLPCGHQCSARCSDVCACTTCAENARHYHRQLLNSANQDEDFLNDNILDDGFPQHETGPAMVPRGNDNQGQSENSRLKATAVDMLVELNDERHAQNVVDTIARPAWTNDSASPSLPPSTTWLHAPDDESWNIETTKITAKRSHQSRAHTNQEKKTLVNAYQKFAQGGAVDDDRRRAENSSRAAAQAVERARQLGVDTSGAPNFGGAIPMRLASRRVEDVAPNLTSPMQTSQNRLHNLSGTLDPFLDDTATRFGDEQDDVQDMWDGSQRAGSSQYKPPSITNPKSQVQGGKSVDSLVQAQYSGGKISQGWNVPQESLIDVASPPPSQGGRKKYVHTWEPMQAARAEVQEAPRGNTASKDKKQAVKKESLMVDSLESREEKETTAFDKVFDGGELKDAQDGLTTTDVGTTPSLLD